MFPRIRRTLLAVPLVLATAALPMQGAEAVAAAKYTTATKHYTESEPAEAAGRNDSTAAAQWLAGFGSAAWQYRAATVRGTLSPTPVEIEPGVEDEGSIPLATRTGIGVGDRRAVTTTGQLGDGPHGTLGDQTGDFDFYQLSATAGQIVTVTTDGSSDGTNTVVGVYDAAGQLLASDDDSGIGLQAKLAFTAPATGDYSVVVAGKSPAGDFPSDPTDSGSGLGSADTGPYQLLISAAPIDRDFYAVSLRKGDVLGVGLSTGGKRLAVQRFNGEQLVGSDVNVRGLLPASSPVPSGPVNLAYVADRSGWYAVSVTDGYGPYELNLTATRPGTETGSTPQTFFLDFNGGAIDTTPLGGSGTRQLSGLAAFLPAWGLTAADESAVISKTVAVVTENVRNDLVSRSGNDNVRVRIRNSRDDADTFGGPRVSRVVVGGSTAESGISRIGAAQSVDPGNYAQEETALVQLGRLSSATGAASFNRYLGAGSDRIDFVGQALGNLVSREIGHLAGNFDTDPAAPLPGLMNADGNFPALYGVGADVLGGTADDVDVDFVAAPYAPAVGLTGTQNTLDVAAWGLTGPR